MAKCSSPPGKRRRKSYDIELKKAPKVSDRRRFSCPILLANDSSYQTQFTNIRQSHLQQSMRADLMTRVSELTHQSRVIALKEEKRKEVLSLVQNTGFAKKRDFWQKEATSCSQAKIKPRERCFKRSYSLSEIDQSYTHLRSPVPVKKPKPHVMPKPKGLFRRVSEGQFGPDPAKLQRQDSNNDKENEPVKQFIMDFSFEQPSPITRSRIDCALDTMMFDKYLDNVVDNALGQGYACASQRSSTTDSSESSKASSLYNGYEIEEVERSFSALLAAPPLDLRSLLAPAPLAMSLPDPAPLDQYLDDVVSGAFTDALSLLNGDNDSTDDESKSDSNTDKEETEGDHLYHFSSQLAESVIEEFYEEQFSPAAVVDEEQFTLEECQDHYLSANQPENTGYVSEQQYYISDSDNFEPYRCLPTRLENTPRRTSDVARRRLDSDTRRSSEAARRTSESSRHSGAVARGTSESSRHSGAVARGTSESSRRTSGARLSSTSEHQHSSSDSDSSADEPEIGMYQGSVMGYADKLSDTIIEEVFKMLVFPEESTDTEDDESDDDDSDQDDDGDSDKGESVADNEDLHEFIDEYVSDVISSAITEVSMTTDSGVDEGCDDSETTTQSLEQMAYSLVKLVIERSVNIVNKSPTTPIYGTLALAPTTPIYSSLALGNPPTQPSPPYSYLAIHSSPNHLELNDPLSFYVQPPRDSQPPPEPYAAPDPVLEKLTKLCKSLEHQEKEEPTLEDSGGVFENWLQNSLDISELLTTQQNRLRSYSEHSTHSEYVDMTGGRHPPPRPERNVLSDDEQYVNSLQKIITNARREKKRDRMMSRSPEKRRVRTKKVSKEPRTRTDSSGSFNDTYSNLPFPHEPSAVENVYENNEPWQSKGPKQSLTHYYGALSFKRDVSPYILAQCEGEAPSEPATSSVVPRRPPPARPLPPPVRPLPPRALPKSPFSIGSVTSLPEVAPVNVTIDRDDELDELYEDEPLTPQNKTLEGQPLAKRNDFYYDATVPEHEYELTNVSEQSSEHQYEVTANDYQYESTNGVRNNEARNDPEHQYDDISLEQNYDDVNVEEDGSDLELVAAVIGPVDVKELQVTEVELDLEFDIYGEETTDRADSGINESSCYSNHSLHDYYNNMPLNMPEGRCVSFYQNRVSSSSQSMSLSSLGSTQSLKIQFKGPTLPKRCMSLQPEYDTPRSPIKHHTTSYENVTDSSKEMLDWTHSASHPSLLNTGRLDKSTSLTSSSRCSTGPGSGLICEDHFTEHTNYRESGYEHDLDEEGYEVPLDLLLASDKPHECEHSYELIDKSKPSVAFSTPGEYTVEDAEEWRKCGQDSEEWRQDDSHFYELIDSHMEAGVSTQHLQMEVDIPSESDIYEDEEAEEAEEEREKEDEEVEYDDDGDEEFEEEEEVFRRTSSTISYKLPLRRISIGKTEFMLDDEDIQPSSSSLGARSPNGPDPNIQRSSKVISTCEAYSYLRTYSSISSGQTGDHENSEDSMDSSNSDLEGSEVADMIVAEALWDHHGKMKDHLTFKAGDLIEVTRQLDGRWWKGRDDGGKLGWFPANSVRLRISKEATEEDLAPVQDAGRRKTILQRMNTMSSKPLNPDWVRQKVIEEILSTEEEFVKQLKNVIDGPLKQARLRTDLFTEETINTLFCNIEEVYEFQKVFLSSLKSQLKSYIYKSELGDTFKDNQQEFVEVYSRYCNNYSSAIAEYTLLNNKMVYSIFFESCRLLQEMKDISLDGFLLTPVQRICKYPLQLRELQKYTNPSHTDYAPVKAAEQLMTMVAETVNERKRRTENIHSLVQWQTSIENWRGEDILQRSSVMIHSGPCCKISVGNKQGRIFYLFDHQLVYCRKVLHGKLQYKGRLDLDVCQLIDLEDNAEPGLYNAWKLKNTEKDKWITIYTKKSEDKEKWMHAFKAERSQVLDDKKNNFVIPENQRKAAYANVLCQKNQKTLERNKKNNPQKYKSTSSLIEEEGDKKKIFSNKMFQKKSRKNVLS